MQQKNFLKEKKFYLGNKFIPETLIDVDTPVQLIRARARIDAGVETTEEVPFNERREKKMIKYNKFSHRLHILITSNNIFCNFSDNLSKKTLFICNSGKYKVKITKKRVNANYYSVLTKFFTFIQSKIKNKKKRVNFKSLIVTIVSAAKMRTNIINFVYNTFRERKLKLLINVLNKKTFNGCRPKKKIRKKRRGLRVFK